MQFDNVPAHFALGVCAIRVSPHDLPSSSSPGQQSGIDWPMVLSTGISLPHRPLVTKICQMHVQPAPHPVRFAGWTRGICRWGTLKVAYAYAHIATCAQLLVAQKSLMKA